jgi:hypothetical protein
VRQGRPNRAASTFASVRAEAECEALDLRHLGDKIEAHIARLMGAGEVHVRTVSKLPCYGGKRASEQRFKYMIKNIVFETETAPMRFSPWFSLLRREKLPGAAAPLFRWTGAC